MIDTMTEHMASAEAQARLDALLAFFEEQGKRQVGYPCNQDFDYSALTPFLDYCPNNVGDPFHPSNFRSNTHEMEREVVGRFADMMHIERDKAWGYVTNGAPRATCTVCTWGASCSRTA